MDDRAVSQTELIDYTPSIESQARLFLIEFNAESEMFLAMMKDSGVVLV